MQIQHVAAKISAKMSWSKFNESLNSLKGQVSTFIDTIVPEEDPEEVAERPDDAELSGLVAAQENEVILLVNLFLSFPYHSSESWASSDHLGGDESPIEEKAKIEG